jgi:hypothetical protein
MTDFDAISNVFIFINLRIIPTTFLFGPVRVTRPKFLSAGNIQSKKVAASGQP